MKQIEVTRLTGFLIDQTGRLHVHFSDPLNQEWEIVFSTLEIAVFMTALQQASQVSGLDLHAIEEDVRRKYGHLFHFASDS